MSRMSLVDCTRISLASTRRFIPSRAICQFPERIFQVASTTPHPDRDAQFHHITSTCKVFEQKGNPIISVDWKKKELLGNCKTNGREWQAKGEQTSVNVYDFLSLADGKAVPYGVYDLVHKRGEVLVGMDHDTAEFAVESIRRWWHSIGKALYPGKQEVLITADGGGSNRARNRLWKKKLQELANEEHLTITVAHYPPATVPRGTRLSIDSFPSFPSKGSPNLSPPLKSCWS